MTIPSNLTNPRSCEYFKFSTPESSWTIFNKEKTWSSALWQGSKTVVWNLGAVPCERVLNRLIDLGKVLCWMTQWMPISLVFTKSLDKLYKENSELSVEKISSIIEKCKSLAIQEYQPKIEKLTSENTRLQNELKDLERSNKGLAIDKKKYQDQLKELNTNIEELTSVIKGFNSENKRLQSEIKQNNSRIEYLEKNNNTLKKLVDRLKSEKPLLAPTN